VITEILPRNTAVKQSCIFLNGKFSPDSHEKQPGLLADLQEARATKILLIKRENNHAS